MQANAFPHGAGIDRRACLRALVSWAAVAVPAAFAAEGYEWRAWPRGKRAPALELPQLDGTPWRLSAQAGRLVLMNFWASWCAPCREEMPSLMRLAARGAADGLVVATVNYRESPATVARFVDSLGLRLPVLLDAEGTVAAAYAPRIFPSTVVIDRRGRPVGSVVGAIDWDGEAARRILDAVPDARGAR